jgi:hypothetical protein
MSPNDDRPPLCVQVLDRLVEGGPMGDGDGGDPLLSEHLGSCVTCFRAMTELRDAPRVAEALRTETSALARAQAGFDDRFWDELAERTTDAALAALGAAAPAKTTAPATARARARRSAGSRTRIFSVAATLAAAAAGFLLVARQPTPNPGLPSSPALVVPALGSHGTRSASAARERPDPVTDEEADVTDLDAGALRRLLDRLRPRAPAALTASSINAGGDSADVLGDDEGRVNEELADLDGDELRRVATSLAAGAAL